MKSVGVVGSGLVGPLVAIGLKRLGYVVSLYEKRVDERVVEGSAGRSINLVVTKKGITALSKMDLWNKVKEITVPVYGRMMHDKAGQLTYQPYGKDNSECNYSVSRSQLNYLLISEAEKEGVRVVFDHQAENVDLDSGVISFTNHEKVKHDIVIGADGAGSVVRKSLLEKSNGSESIDWLNVNYKELLMPASKAGDFVMEGNALHIWPRNEHMLMALPNLDGSFTMTLYLPTEGSNCFEKRNSDSEIEKLFLENYKDSMCLMPDYRKECLDNPLGKLGTVRCEPWVFEDKGLLIGDAAHAIVPFFGQGMNAAFEDCTTLLKCLEETENISSAFEKYYKVQKPSGDAIADMAVENYTEMAEKVGDRKFLFKKEVERELTKKFGEKYVSRYRLVVYTDVPYSIAQKVGKIQDEILDEICFGKNNLNDVDFSLAEKLIDQKLAPEFNLESFH